MFNYFPCLSCKEQFGDQARGGESHSVPSRRRAYGSPTAPLPSTDPPSSFPRERLTSQNLITLLTRPICSVADREGINYICVRLTGKPSFLSHPPGILSTACKGRGKAGEANRCWGLSTGSPPKNVALWRGLHCIPCSLGSGRCARLPIPGWKAGSYVQTGSGD